MQDEWMRRLSEFIVPTKAELQTLESVKSASREFGRRQTIIGPCEPVREIYFVADGWVESSVEIGAGRKQVTGIYLPGDFAGLPNVAMARTAESLVALTPVLVNAIPVERLPDLFEQAPRLGCMLFVRSQQERVALMDQLAAVGQTSSLQRLAALLVHMHRRLAAIRPGIGNTIDWPLSQERVGQFTGMTSVHVNRSFAELTRLGLIWREGRNLTLTNFDGLVGLAGTPERRSAQQPSWLASCCVTDEKA